MAFVDRTLTFEPNRIYYYDEIFDMDNEVMMDWETPIMQAKADYVCSNGGNILEFGRMSCEDIGEWILNNNPGYLYKVEVWEDWENGAIIER